MSTLSMSWHHLLFWSLSLSLYLRSVYPGSTGTNTQKDLHCFSVTSKDSVIHGKRMTFLEIFIFIQPPLGNPPVMKSAHSLLSSSLNLSSLSLSRPFLLKFFILSFLPYVSNFYCHFPSSEDPVTDPKTESIDPSTSIVSIFIRDPLPWPKVHIPLPPFSFVM